MTEDEMARIEKHIERTVKRVNQQCQSKILSSLKQNYTQLESFIWLQKKLLIKNHLPPLRGWPVSPDFLLYLHSWIVKNRPKVIVELGSGASTIVIADALKQNGCGRLISLEHLEKFFEITNKMILDEKLEPWVDLRLAPLEIWNDPHFFNENINVDEQYYWYSTKNLNDLRNIDLLLVDGPPGGTCKYARYPAVPYFIERLSIKAEIWMDDAVRKDEIEICNAWSDKYNLKLESIDLEKGLIVAKKNESHSVENPLNLTFISEV